MAIPSYDFLEKPYDDIGLGATLKYVYSENRYVALVEGISDDTYVNLVDDWGSKDNAQSYLDLLSRVVYETILAFKDQKYRNLMLYYLSHSKVARETLIRIFSDTIWYNRRDGGFMMAYNSGANLNQGKLIEFGIDKAISPIAKQLVKNTIFGTRILTLDINTQLTFDTLEELLDYLVAQGYITEDEKNVVLASEDLGDLPYHEEYDVIELDNGKYLYIYLNTLSDAVQNMKKYNTLDGDW